MKILIVNAYTRANGGDAAILSVLIDQLKHNWPDADIVISSMEKPSIYPDFETCKNIGSIRLYSAAEDRPKLVRLSHKAVVAVLETLWLHLPMNLKQKTIYFFPGMIVDELRTILAADLVVSLGGGYLNGGKSLAGNLNVRYILLPLRIAEAVHKPVVFAPQSFGPFGTPYQTKLVQSVLQHAQLIMVREDKSMNILRTIGINNNLLVRTVDSGFAFDSTSAKSSTRVKPMKVGITARSWLSGSGQYGYELSLKTFIEYIIKHYDAEVYLIPQVTSDMYNDDDRIVEKRIFDLLPESDRHVHLFKNRLTHHELKQLYNELTFTVGTRFHSVIFSLTSYVPAIAIEYEHKTGGIMHDLELDNWVIKIDQVTATRLKDRFDTLVKQRDDYLQHLEKVMPKYIETAQSGGLNIKLAFDQSRLPE